MQTFLGPIFTEGILTSGILAIGRCLTEPEVCWYLKLPRCFHLTPGIVRPGTTALLVCT
jgi:hypothetical protein